VTDLRTTLAAVSLAAALVAPFAVQAQAAPAPPPEPSPAQPITMEQAVAASLELNPDLIKTRLLSQSAVQDQVLAKANILPNLNFNASYGLTRVGGGEFLGNQTIQGTTVSFFNPVQHYPSYGIGLSVRQLIFDGGKWWNNLEVADKAYASTKEQIAEQRLQTIFTVRQRFYELVRAQRQLDVLKEAAVRSRDQADWTQRLYEGGRATQADVYAARANRDNDEVNRLGQEAKVESARQDLAIGIGRDPTAPLNVIDPPELQQDISAAPAPQETVERALAQRPSLKAFVYQLQSLQKGVDVAKGDYWPTVNFNGSYQRATRNLDDFTKAPDQANTLSGSINLQWNLFAGYSTDANVEKAKIQVLLTQNDYVAGRRGVASDVEKAIAGPPRSRSA
jgi:outer membrane protein